ncbi:MAG: baseplate J/gp47 family protein [Schwartzia sp.]|nr:baseplate J/gp47 family protein [Schwartzia sp. (in: firmicutes)]
MSSYTAREQEDILTELQGFSAVEASKFEGTFEYDVLSSNSIEFAKIEVELEELYKAAFADTSWGDYLTMIAGQAGVLRKAAVNAIGIVTARGNGKVPAGSLFSTAGGIRFRTNKEAIIVNEGDITVTAVNAGDSGNVEAGTINLIPMSIPGIMSVTNAEATTDGYDEETDEALLERYLIKVRMPATSGNPWHYYEWATAVEGVGNAKIIRCWDGPNTVKVIIADSNLEEASDTLVQKTFEYIEERRPIGARVTVVSARALPIDVSVKITAGSFDMDTYIKAAKEYLKTVAHDAIGTLTQQSVSIAQLGSLILTSGGARDYDDLLINGTTENVELGAEEIPSLGEVLLSGE